MEDIFKHTKGVDPEIFDFIKCWVIRYFRLTQDNEHGYVTKKVEDIKSIRNVGNYGAMSILNMLHVISRREIIHETTPMSVIDYVTKNSTDLNDIIKYKDDPKLTKNLARYRKIKKILDEGEEN